MYKGGTFMDKNYYGNYHPNRDNFSRLIEGLKAAIIDERQTAEFYSLLRDMSETFDGVDTFAEARKDELDHAVALTQLVETLTGTTPREATVPVNPSRCRNYCDGVQRAIEGEKNAVIEYEELQGILPIPFVNNTLQEIRNDEEVHLAKMSKLYKEVCKHKYFAKEKTGK